MKDKIPITGILGGILVIYYIAPILSLLTWGSGEGIISSVRDEVVISAILTSMTTSFFSVCISGIFGIPLAYVLSREVFKGKNIILFLVFLPLILPPIVSGMVLLTLFGPESILNSFFIFENAYLTQSKIGIIIAQVFVSSPFIVIASKVGFDSVDRKLEYASRSLGKTRIETFWRITIPLSIRGILAGAMLAFTRSMGEFGATIMMAYYPRTMPTQIWVSFITEGLDKTVPMVMLLLLSSVIGIVLLSMLGKEVMTNYTPY